MISSVALRSLVGGLALVALGACEEIRQVRETPNLTSGYGEATLDTMTKQIADPLPVDTRTPSNMSGERAALAMERYKTNTSIKPRAVGTGVSIGGGGGSGGK